MKLLDNLLFIKRKKLLRNTAVWEIISLKLINNMSLLIVNNFLQLINGVEIQRKCKSGPAELDKRGQSRQKRDLKSKTALFKIYYNFSNQVYCFIARVFYVLFYPRDL